MTKNREIFHISRLRLFATLVVIINMHARKLCAILIFNYLVTWKRIKWKFSRESQVFKGNLIILVDT